MLQPHQLPYRLPFQLDPRQVTPRGIGPQPGTNSRSSLVGSSIGRSCERPAPPQLVDPYAGYSPSFWRPSLGGPPLPSLIPQPAPVIQPIPVKMSAAEAYFGDKKGSNPDLVNQYMSFQKNVEKLLGENERLSSLVVEQHEEIRDLKRQSGVNGSLLILHEQGDRKTVGEKPLDDVKVEGEHNLDNVALNAQQHEIEITLSAREKKGDFKEIKLEVDVNLEHPFTQKERNGEQYSPDDVSLLKEENKFLRGMVLELQSEVENLNKQMLSLLQEKRERQGPKKEVPEAILRETIMNRLSKSPIGGKTVTINLDNSDIMKSSRGMNSTDRGASTARNTSKPKERRKILTLLKTRDWK